MIVDSFLTSGDFREFHIFYDSMEHGSLTKKNEICWRFIGIGLNFRPISLAKWVKNLCGSKLIAGSREKGGKGSCIEIGRDIEQVFVEPQTISFHNITIIISVFCSLLSDVHKFVKGKEMKNLKMPSSCVVIRSLVYSCHSRRLWKIIGFVVKSIIYKHT